VLGGVSISPGNRPLSGTGGLIVYQDGIPCILSNNHVLRMSQIPNPDERPQKGSPVWQPSRWDGGTQYDAVAGFRDWIEVDLSGGLNETDCAVAGLTIPHIPYILGLGSPRGLVENPAELWNAQTSTWAKLWKSGRSSGITEGRVFAIAVTIKVSFGGGLLAIFVNQIAVEPMLIAGDSGSVLLTDDDRVAGLGFAASPNMSFANPIQVVFTKLNLTLPSPITPVEQIMPQLGENAIIRGFDNEKKIWTVFRSGLPEKLRRHPSTLRHLVPGQGYWIRVDKDIHINHNGFSWKMWQGWNLIGWR